MPTRSTPEVPTIACIDLAKTPLGVDLDRLIGALRKFVDHHLAPVWGTPAKPRRARGGEVTTIFGSKPKRKDFRKEDRRLHRTESLR